MPTTNQWNKIPFWWVSMYFTAYWMNPSTSTVQLHCIQNISVCSRKLGVSEEDKGSQWKWNQSSFWFKDWILTIMRRNLFSRTELCLSFTHSLGTDGCAEVSPLPHVATLKTRSCVTSGEQTSASEHQRAQGTAQLLAALGRGSVIYLFSTVLAIINWEPAAAQCSNTALFPSLH